MKSRSPAFALFALVLSLGLMAGLRDRMDDWVTATELPRLTVPVGTEVTGRDGTLLRAFQVADGRWRLEPGTVDPLFTRMLVSWEDRRFFRHHGVDALAALRAGLQAARHGRVVSGGSTLTMQVARLLEEGPTGQWSGKLRQLRLALALERRLDKTAILDLYLRLAPYGANVEGIRAASLQWFGKEPRRLTPAEAALLVALPQAPEARRPDRFPETAKAARNRVLAQAAARGVISGADARAAMAEPVPQSRRPFPALAPLLAGRLQRENPGSGRIETTIDPGLQRRAEQLARRAAGTAGRGVSAAILLADHRTGEILADVGTSEWTDAGAAGFVDMTRAWRSPGSTLKPFVYGLAFDQGVAHPETLIEDRPSVFGRWQPQNFDHAFRGTVSLRQALVWSLNIPVVKLAETLGPNRVAQALERGGVALRLPGGTAGLALVLGGGGVTLEGLVAGYGALARGGQGMAPSALPGGAQIMPAALFGPVAAWQIGNILAGNPAPRGARLRPMAYKTGTSYGHRDALAVGFDGAHVAAVWLGRPDGTPVPGAFGGDLAAPVLFDLFDALPPVPLPPPPPHALTVPNSALPLPLRRFAPPGEVSRTVAEPPAPDRLVLLFPPDGAALDASGGLAVKARGGRGPWTFLLDGAPVGLALPRPELLLPKPQPGFVQLSVIDAAGSSASATVWLQMSEILQP